MTYAIGYASSATPSPDSFSSAFRTDSICRVAATNRSRRGPPGLACELVAR